MLQTREEEVQKYLKFAFERSNQDDSWTNWYKYHSKLGYLPIGLKRNIGVEAATNDIVLFMDDDDYYYPESINRRVEELVNNDNVNCVGITTTGTFDINNFVSSMNVAPFHQKYGRRLTPSSLCFYRSFWEDRKFSEVDSYETADFLDNRITEFREISWEGIMVGLVHSKNMLLSYLLHHRKKLHPSQHKDRHQ